jgi:GTP cyclohydrolase IA
MTTSFLTSLGFNLCDPHMKDTQSRWEDWMRKATQNQNAAWPLAMMKAFPSSYVGPVKIEGIEFSSICCHHLAPFFGTVDIIYHPRGSIVGLSKFARAVEWFSLRAQTQEKLTPDLAEFIYQSVDTSYVSVTVTAKHTCMSCRGVRQDATTTTQAIRTK